MTTATYRVTGMTCDNCVQAVRREVSSLAGVTDVMVDLASGQLTIASEGPLDDQAVRAAVDEAGFDIVAAAAP